jgi:hypothetical protein
MIRSRRKTTYNKEGRFKQTRKLQISSVGVIDMANSWVGVMDMANSFPITLLFDSTQA